MGAVEGDDAIEVMKGGGEETWEFGVRPLVRVSLASPSLLECMQGRERGR